jgi:SAM-dependent methyltransferase
MTAPANYILPKPGSDLSVDDVRRFYRLIYRERDEADLTSAEQAKLFHPTRGFGNMAERPAYYLQAFVKPFHRALVDIFTRFPRPRILDLCCGTGTQSLMFAALGAEVVAVDDDPLQLATLAKRQIFHERLAGRGLAISRRQADATAADLSAFGAFDAVYSHGGIGQVLPAALVFERLGPLINPGGLLLLKNGNPACWWLRARGVAALDSPRAAYLAAAAAHGFAVVRARGTTVFPRPLWPTIAGIDLPLQLLDPLFASVTVLQVHLEYAFAKPSI